MKQFSEVYGDNINNKKKEVLKANKNSGFSEISKWLMLL